MFLQGSASVYSKKVEFLWQSVLKMIDLLASKNALDEVEGPGKYCFFENPQIQWGSEYRTRKPHKWLITGLSLIHY
jgi:hypothetical protein